MSENINFKIVYILSIGLAYASAFGYISQRVRLSPILGYMLAGFLIGPYSPGYTADLKLAEQLAEIGVILMMFSVGLHFKWQDLWVTRYLSLPGAFLQTLATTLVTMLFMQLFGWSIEAGLIMGFAIGVASTVVLVRILSDHDLLNTPQGHVALGWLIVEDFITVLVLLILSPLALSSQEQQFPLLEMLLFFMFTLLKFVALVFFLFTLGGQLLTYLLNKVLKMRSHELFTLTILAITFLIATGSAWLLGTSIALGAFIAGMLVGQTRMRELVSLNTRPLKELFVVLFFLSIGMLFNPKIPFQDLPLFSGILAMILILKPLVAFTVTLLLRSSTSTALTVAIGLAQIGEFSFILAEEATRLDVMPDEGYDIIVAAALISIALNPLGFKLLKSRLKIAS